MAFLLPVGPCPSFTPLLRQNSIPVVECHFNSLLGGGGKKSRMGVGEAKGRGTKLLNSPDPGHLST